MAQDDANSDDSDSTDKDIPTTRSHGNEPGTQSAARDNDFDRRSFLKLTGAATSAVAASGLASASAAASTGGISFDAVVNAVADLGMDDTGQQAIDAALDDALQSGRLIEFPPGDYLVTRRHELQGLDRFGIRGTGDGPRDVTFVPPSGAWLRAFTGGGGSFGQALFENFSFDQRDDEETLIAANFRTSGGARFRDIELIGRGPREMDSASFKFGIQVTDRSGVAVVENFTAGMDQRSVEVPYGEGVICMYGGPSHRGELVLRDPTVHNQNGSPFRYTNVPGVVTVEGGTFVNNQNTCFRFCGGRHPSKHSVADGVYIKLDRDMTDTSEAIRLDASSSGGYGAEFRNCHVEMTEAGGRGCITAPSFGEHGSATFRNCVIRNETGAPMVNARGFSGNRPPETAIVFEDCDITGNGDFVALERPDSVVRNSCVDVDGSVRGDFSTENLSTSGCERPDGATTGTGTTDLPHVLTIEGDQGAADYEVTVSGDLEKSTDHGASINDDDTVSGNSAEGFVDGGTDSFGFTGEIVQFSLSDPATVSVNGQEVDPTSLGNLNNTLTITGEGTATNYAFTVSGGLVADVDEFEKWDSLDGSSADGWVTETHQRDLFYFAGEVTDFAFREGEAAVHLDGQEVDPATLGRSDSDAHTLQITGEGTATNYVFTVGGDLQADPDADDVEPWDSIQGSTADGWVTETHHVDTYRFTGDVTDFAFREGDATVHLDGQEVDPATLGGGETSHTLQITGTGTPTNYAFTVGGDLQADPDADDVEPWDAIDGSSADGWVTDPRHVDTYQFTGDLTDFTFREGTATVHLDGQEVDPASL